MQLTNLIYMKGLFLFIIGAFLHLTLHSQNVVQMKRESGVSKIPCKVNGLNLEFIFDTGASDVTISLTEALFMLKNNYLLESDIIGKENYKTASGDISEGYQIILREIEFAGLKLYNVKASIIKTSDAPLLLGQSALSKLGDITINLENNTLSIKSNSNKTKLSPENYSNQPSAKSNKESEVRILEIDKMKIFQLGSQNLIKNETILKAYKTNGLFYKKLDIDGLKKIILSIVKNNSADKLDYRSDYDFMFADNFFIIDANSHNIYNKEILRIKEAIDLKYLYAVVYSDLSQYGELLLNLSVKGNHLIDNYNYQSDSQLKLKEGDLLSYSKTSSMWSGISGTYFYLQPSLFTSDLSKLLAKCFVEISRRLGNKLAIKTD